jgi:pyridoxamine 5'-phosphate oxidase family protein
MSAFTAKEIEYLHGQRLGRMATVGSGGKPHVAPVGFRLDDETGTIEIGGHDLAATKKFRDLRANPNIAFVVDDLESVNPWTPRGIEIRGQVELFEQGGDRFGAGWGAAWIRIVPERIIGWGIDSPTFSGTGPHARSVS